MTQPRRPSAARKARPATAALALLLLLPACGLLGGGSKTDSSLDHPVNDALQVNSPEGLYAAGLDAMKHKRYPQAVELFDRIQQNFPYSSWATNSRIMAAYSEYMRGRYTEAIGDLDRYIQLHPASRDIAYAYYLRALCYYEQIEDVQRDQSTTQLAINALQDVINRYPDTAYARDAQLKIDLGRDHLAGQEMLIGRFYERQKLYSAAINRYQTVVDSYQTTSQVPEALYRLTEVYVALGLPQEARKVASVLGANFPGSRWYQDAYALLTPNARAADSDEKPGFLARTADWIF